MEGECAEAGPDTVITKIKLSVAAFMSIFLLQDRRPKARPRNQQGDLEWDSVIPAFAGGARADTFVRRLCFVFNLAQIAGLVLGLPLPRPACIATGSATGEVTIFG